MGQALSTLCLVALVTSHIAASAGEVTWSAPDTAHWRGSFDDAALTDLERVFAEHPVRHLAFSDSTGGTRAVVKAVIAEVRARGLATSAQGACTSACALAFLAGTTRTLLPSQSASPTKIGLHGVYDATSHRLIPPTPQEFDYLLDSTDHKMPHNLVNIVLNTRSMRGGLMVFERPLQTPAGPQRVLYCDLQDGDADDARLACEPLSNDDAESLGIATPVRQHAN